MHFRVLPGLEFLLWAMVTTAAVHGTLASLGFLVPGASMHSPVLCSTETFDRSEGPQWQPQFRLAAQ